MGTSESVGRIGGAEEYKTGRICAVHIYQKTVSVEAAEKVPDFVNLKMPSHFIHNNLI